MKTLHKKFDNIKSFLILLLVIITFSSISILPWWSFLLPVFISGVIANYLNWIISSFFIGFLCGFISWFCVNLYYDLTFNGAILLKIANSISISKYILLVASGLVGGLITGLAYYSGYIILKNEKNK